MRRPTEQIGLKGSVTSQATWRIRTRRPARAGWLPVTRTTCRSTRSERGVTVAVTPGARKRMRVEATPWLGSPTTLTSIWHGPRMSGLAAGEQLPAVPVARLRRT